MPNERRTEARKAPAPVVLDDRRDQVIATLAAQFAADRLTMDQLERRMDLAQRADNVADLDLLVADLPALPQAGQSAGVAAQPGRIAPANAVRERQVLAAIMGGVERKGHWVPARHTMVFTFMGGADLDLREAALPREGAEIACFAMWGGTTVIVPPDVRVDLGGLAIMGGFSQNRGYFPDPGPDAPTVRITGFALMGGVEVIVRLPGESAGEARRRIKEERKRLKGSKDSS